MKSKSMKTKSMKNFWIIFVGQFVSMLGSGVSSFGLSIWVLLQTDSATLFTLTAFASALPSVFLAPITGSIADRYDRKKIIILCDSLDAVLKLCILTLFFFGRFEIWMIVVFNLISSTLGAFQGPAFNASLPVIVPKENLEKANSMMMLLYAIKLLATPVIAGFLYPVVGILGLFIVDFITYAVAIITILPQNLKHKIPEKTGEKLWRGIKNDFIFTMDYLKNMGVFLKILYLNAAFNVTLSFVMPLLGPLVMSNYDSKIYGIVEASFGFAMILGSIITNFIPSKNKMLSMYRSILLAGIFVTGVAFSPKWYFIAMFLFLFALPLPRVNGIFGALVQRKIDNSVLGKVSAITMAIMNVFSPFVTLLSGVLADYVFKPLLVEGGVLSTTVVASLIGVGETRGIGLMFLLSGVIVILLGIMALRNKKMMSFDSDCPDAIQEDSKPLEVNEVNVVLD